MANTVKVAFNKTTRTVTLLAAGDAIPGGSVDAGTFVTKFNKVAINFVRDLLYKLGVQNLQGLIVTKGANANLAP